VHVGGRQLARRHRATVVRIWDLAGLWSAGPGLAEHASRRQFPCPYRVTALGVVPGPDGDLVIGSGHEVIMAECTPLNDRRP
jgi:hypothetical protein